MFPAGNPADSDGRIVAVLPKCVDLANAELIGNRLLAAARSLQAGGIVVADMSGTSFIDTSGVKHLLLARSRAAAIGVDLRLAALTDATLRVLELMGLERVVPVYPTLARAMLDALPGSVMQIPP